MPNTKKIIICALVILSTLSLTINYSNSNSQLSSSPLIHTSNGDWETFTGDYTGNSSIMYLYEETNSSFWSYQNSSTNYIPHNKSIENREYDLNRVEIWADNLINETGAGTFTIADNVSRQINLTSSMLVAQRFTATDLVAPEQIMLYINYTLPFIPKYGYFYYVLHIFNENFQEELDIMWVYEDRLAVDEWITFWPRPVIFEPGKKYNLMFHIFMEDDFLFPIDFWRAENYTNPSYDKGLTLVNDGHQWTRVPMDLMRDMLCNFTYKKLIKPETVDLKFIINNQTIIPKYQQSTAGQWGYEGYLSYTIDTPLEQALNITVTTNQTMDTMFVYILFTYIFLIEANGTYLVNNGQLTWTLDYPYKDISFGWPPPLFLFEQDWDFDEMLDPDGIEVDDIYFGPVELFNVSYLGITTLFGPPLERGTYRVTFHSPNYCHIIKTKVESGGQFITKSSLELGQTILLEAEINNSDNEPISGGTGQIALFSSSGTLIHNESGLTSINGIMSSSVVELNSNLVAGNYEARIFWTDGREIAFYTIQIEVRDPGQIVLFIAIGLIAAVASTPVALVLRRQIKQRNWEKSLKNLFVLTHDGLSLYEYSFGIEIQDPALISAMIAALTNFVREATGSKKALRTVDQEDKKVILYHGKYTTVALLSEKDLPIIHKRIMKFAEAFEGNYGKQLKTWKGETTLFKGTEILVNKYFPIDVESQVIHGVRQKLIEFREKLEALIYPKDIISFMRTITEFISRYRVIVNKYYLDYYNEIIITAEEKISSA